MIIDSHCHYNMSPLYENWKTYWAESQANGIHASIIVGADHDMNTKGVDIAEQTQNLWCSVGYHPTDAQCTNIEEDMLALETFAIKHPKKVVAIGECGLDYFRITEEPQAAEKEKRRQQILFGKHIQLAKKLDLPIIIHCRDAQDDLLDTLNHFCKDDGKVPRGVLHCAAGDLPYLKKGLDLGLYIGFAGNVTYKNAEQLRELARNTPIDRMLLETDAPFLSPQSKRGQVNEPKNIKETAEFLANLLHKEYEAFCKQIEENTKKLFGI